MNIRSCRTTHTKEELEKIETLSPCGNTHILLSRMLWYYKKHYNNKTGKLDYSLSKLYKMYSRTHKISRSYFFTLMSKIQKNFYQEKQDEIL